MPAHDYHENLPGFDERQLLVDGCEECEFRGKHPLEGLNHMDNATMMKAIARAITWQTCDGYGSDHYLNTIGRISHAEAPVLETIWTVMIKMRNVLPFDMFAPIRSQWGGTL